MVKKICVIGAGVMGSGIAAQIANSGTEVLLMDIASAGEDPTIIAKNAKAKMLAGKIPQLAHKNLAALVTPANLNDDLEKLTNCDWVIEVIVEKLEVKEQLYKKIAPYLNKNACLSSNTSTIPLAELSAILPENLKPNFILTHFFNPPRQMQLLELVTSSNNNPQIVKNISDFITNKLGKTIVISNDTPGFIANRIGCFLLELTLKLTYENNLSIELVDHIFSKYLGLPSTAIFGLYDLIGLDVMTMIGRVLVESLPNEDKFCTYFVPPADEGPLDLLGSLRQKMLKDNYIGRKGLGGFYRMRQEGDKKIKEVLKFSTMEYIPAGRVTLPDAINIETLLNQPEGKIIRKILQEFFAYVINLLTVVSDKAEDIDLAIKLGYSWKWGPFELLQRLKLADLDIDYSKTLTPYVIDKQLLTAETLIENDAAICRQIASKLCFSVKTKVGNINSDVLKLLLEAIDIAEREHQTLVIYNGPKYFSAGADLKFFLEHGKNGNIDEVADFITLGQQTMLRLKHARTQVIAAATGFALGGGCELLLHSHKILAHLDLTAGLVEVGVGLIPGFGGVKEMILRSSGNPNKLTALLTNIIRQNRTTSSYSFFEDYAVSEGITVMNRDLLLESAIKLPFSPIATAIDHVSIPKNIDLTAQLGELKLDEHTKLIVRELQLLLSNASLSEQEILAWEKNIFLKLLVLPEAHAKIEKVI